MTFSKLVYLDNILKINWLFRVLQRAVIFQIQSAQSELLQIDKRQQLQSYMASLDNARKILPTRHKLLFVFATFHVRTFLKIFKGKCLNLHTCIFTGSANSLVSQLEISELSISCSNKTQYSKNCSQTYLFLNNKEIHRDTCLNELFLSELQAVLQSSTQKQFLYYYFSATVLQALTTTVWF